MRKFVSTTHPGLIRAAALLAVAAMAMLVPQAMRAQGSESFVATHLATLDGDQETPVMTNAGSGICVMRFDPAAKTLSYRLSVALPENDTISAAHFHTGIKGVSGPPVREITFEAGSKTVMGTWENMSDQEVAALNAGGLYVNVHTTRNPGGQIRGQVLPIPNLGASDISSGQETGTITDTTGTGQAFIWLDPAAHALAFNVQWDDLTGAPTAAHFHRGPKGQAGGVIHPIGLPVNAGVSGEASGTWTNLSDADIADLIAGNIYVNVHTAKYPNGEIRGQIYTTEVFTAFISPLNETSTITGSNAQGTAAITLAGDGQLIGVAAINGSTGPITAAHIHTGAKGENGGVFLPLIDFSFFAGPGSWAALSSSTPDSIFTKFRQSGMYMNFHTGQYPNGEARGQLIPAATNLSLGTSSVPVERTAADMSWSTRYDASSGTLHFDRSAKHGEAMSVEVYSMLGQRVASAPVEAGSSTVSIGMLPSGSYIAWMTSNGNVVGMSRIGVVR
jgi:hypothetical protein